MADVTETPNFGIRFPLDPNNQREERRAFFDVDAALAAIPGGDALTTDPLSQFAATTSLQLKGVITDETGSDALVFQTSPTLNNPIITNMAPGADFTITQNAVVPFKSVNASAVVDTLVLKAGRLGVGQVDPQARIHLGTPPYPANYVQKIETSDSIVDLNLTLRGVTNTDGARLNQAMIFGFNIHPGGSNEVVGEGGVGWGLEHYYHPVAGEPLHEHHWFSILSTGEQRRPISHVFARDGSYDEFAIKSDLIRFHPFAGGASLIDFQPTLAYFGLPVEVWGTQTWYTTLGSRLLFLDEDGLLTFGPSSDFPFITQDTGAPSIAAKPGALFLQRPDGVTYRSLWTAIPGNAWACVWHDTILSFTNATAGRLALVSSNNVAAGGAVNIGQSLIADDGTNVDIVSGALKMSGVTAMDASRNLFITGATISGAAPSIVLTDTTASAKSLTVAVDANLAQFRESAGASGSLLVIDLANNRVAIGTAVPDAKLTVSSNAAAALPASGLSTIARFAEADGVQPIFVVDGFGSNPILFGRRANGTAASPTATLANDILYNFAGGGYQTTTNAYTLARAQIRFVAAENYTSTAQGQYFTFWTTAAGGTTTNEKMRLSDVGILKIGGTAIRATTEGTNRLDLFDSTAPAGTLASGVSLFSGSGKLKSADAAGTVGHVLSASAVNSVSPTAPNRTIAVDIGGTTYYIAAKTTND